MTITDAMIWAGARALYAAQWPHYDLEHQSDETKKLYRKSAKAALEAAERAAWRPGSEPVPASTIMLDGKGRRLIWCKTPHVPIYGWHWYDAPDPEDRDIEHPAFVRPLPTLGEPDER